MPKRRGVNCVITDTVFEAAGGIHDGATLGRMAGRRAIELGLPDNYRGEGDRSLFWLIASDETLSNVELTDAGRALVKKLTTGGKNESR